MDAQVYGGAKLHGTDKPRRRLRPQSATGTKKNKTSQGRRARNMMDYS